MNGQAGVYFECCGGWYPAAVYHRRGVLGECVLQALRRPLRERPARSPAPAQMSADAGRTR